MHLSIITIKLMQKTTGVNIGSCGDTELYGVLGSGLYFKDSFWAYLRRNWFVFVPLFVSLRGHSDGT